MDPHAEWIRAQHELTEASKAVHFWDAMPSDLRGRMGAMRYRESRAEARRRFQEADKNCRQASLAKRASMRLESGA